jgi:single-strand selective monofunctional uracil DNA glycosylase
MTPPTLEAVSQSLADAVDALQFGAPVTHVYNPLRYAWRAHAAYLKRCGAAPGRVVMLGMNPGPFGMAQVGVPFGEIALVRDWIRIHEHIDRPEHEHPKRPVLGFDCHRSEVSGRRLWGWARERYGSPDAFFARYVVLNYCPLVFMEASGRNLTPDKLRRDERERLYAACDAALRETLAILQPAAAIGVGGFAGDCLRRVAGERMPVLVAPHPSPASPLANRGWAPLMDVVADQAEALMHGASARVAERA